EAHEAGTAGWLTVDGGQDVAGAAHCGRDQAFIDATRRPACRGGSRDVLVVIGARRYRLFEDRGVRGDAAQTFIGDPSRQVTATDHASREIVHPAALAVREQLNDPVHVRPPIACGFSLYEARFVAPRRWIDIGTRQR